MRFRLIFKQAIRDFRSKLQLYLSFTVFLIVCLSIIIGLLSFSNSYTSIYKNVFVNNGVLRNNFINDFTFVSKDTYANREENVGLNRNVHYVYDKNSEFESFVKDQLKKDNYPTGWKGLDDDQIKSLWVLEKDNKVTWRFIDYLGMNNGRISLSMLNSTYNNAVKNDNEDTKKIAPKDVLLPDAGNNFASLLKPTDDENQDHNQLVYYALAKLNRETNLSKEYLSNHPEDNFYKSSLLQKFIVEEKLKGNKKYDYGYTSLTSWPRIPYGNDTFSYSLMPSEKWMDENSSDKLNTPVQYQRQGLNDIYIEKRMDISQIPVEHLRNRDYVYVTPSFLTKHDLKLGQEFNYKDNGNVVSAYIIGTAITSGTFYNDASRGVVFAPIQFLNTLSPQDEIERHEFEINKAAEKSIYYNGNSILGSLLSINDKAAASDDYDQAAKDVKNDLLNSFIPNKVLNEEVDIWGNLHSIDNPIGWSELKVTKANVFLFKLLCYVISALVAALDIVVFWFIASESIKLQKNTLWFLKALGENNAVLSLLVTLSVMVPFLISAVLSIFGSLFMNNIMVDAVGRTYAFVMPAWSFGVFSLIVLLVISAASFLIFIGLSYSMLAGGALSLHSDNKVGWITKLYMSTKGLYKKLPTGGRIGVSFIFQNLGKNILTLILLVLSFTVVLFSMQFSSSARASAHSYENRNKPYKSLMLNKLNNVDDIQLDTNYIMDNLIDTKEKRNEYKDGLNKLSFGTKALYGDGYNSVTVNSEKDNEQQITKQIFHGSRYLPSEDDQSVQDVAAIDDSKTFKHDIHASFSDVYNVLVNGDITDKDGKIILHARDSFTNKYLTSNYMQNVILNKTQSTESISKDIFNLTDDEIQTDIKQFRKDEDKIINNIFRWLNITDISKDKVKDFLGSDEDLAKVLKNSSIYVQQNFKQQLDDLRTTYNSATVALNVNKIDLSVYFDKVIIPKDLESAFITDLTYGNEQVSSFGLDSRSSETYKRIVNPLGFIPTLTDKELINNKTRYSYKVNKDTEDSINVHYINGYVSSNFADHEKVKTGDVIDLRAIRNPLAYTKNSVGNTNTYPHVFVKIAGVVKESTVYPEVYFNKVDYFNYLYQYINNNWDVDINNQIEINDYLSKPIHPIITSEDKNPEWPSHASDGSNKNESPEQNEVAKHRELLGLQQIVNGIRENTDDAKYVANNSVFSKGQIPYGFSHWTLSNNAMAGYTILDYVKMPILDYSSSHNQINYANSVYVFDLITKQLMHAIQPIITTLNKFVTILLILTFVVALILINLVLLHNRQTILLFKAMGYKKKEVNGYLLSGYIVADIIGLAVGIIISYFGISYASVYAYDLLHVSLYAVWSWQFILTAVLMAVVFIVMILGSVTLYTRRQRPRDAFATL